MAMPDLINLFAYWRETPPLHEIFCAIYQIGSQTSRRKPDVIVGDKDPSGIGDLIQRFPSGFIS